MNLFIEILLSCRRFIDRNEQNLLLEVQNLFIFLNSMSFEVSRSRIVLELHLQSKSVN